MENTTTNKEIIAEEFFRAKIKELNPNQEVTTLSREMITGEQGLRWAHEFTSLQTEAKDREIKELKKEIERLRVDRSTRDKIIVDSDTEIADLESSLSLAKKENEELRNKLSGQEKAHELELIITGNHVQKLNSELTSVKEQLKEYEDLSDHYDRLIVDWSEINKRYHAAVESNTKLVEALEVLISDDPGILEIPKVASALSFKADTNKTKDKH